MKSKPTKVAAIAMPVIQRNNKGQVWSPVRQKWRFETPGEYVRQELLCVLAAEYGHSVERVGEEEELTGRGSAGADGKSAKAIW